MGSKTDLESTLKNPVGTSKPLEGTPWALGLAQFSSVDSRYIIYTYVIFSEFSHMEIM